ncbi:MAG: hypothetical protein HY707_01340 [Ignavibacteriae bacterium]|nr:hypothetical protein [Ignavibacteriota bacterium]
MRRKYVLPELTREQRIVHEYLLLDEIDKQQWYAIVYLTIWKTEGLICIQ